MKKKAGWRFQRSGLWTKGCLTLRKQGKRWVLQDKVTGRYGDGKTFGKLWCGMEWARVNCSTDIA